MSGSEFNSLLHPKSMLSILSQLYFDRVLCDVTLIVDGQHFPAHRVVLAAGSPYFAAMFTNHHLESNQTHITLQDIDMASLESVLRFIYTSNLYISESNVQDLLVVASILQVSPVVEACCDYMKSFLEPDNCLGLHQFADAHGCSGLSENSFQFALEHFQEVTSCEEFLQISPNLLKSLIQSKDLTVQSEVDILDAVLMWLNHSPHDRLSSLPTILQYVKIPLIPSTVLQDKLFKYYTPANPAYDKFHSVINGLQYQASTSDFNPYQPRKCNTQKNIYVIGGETQPGRLTVNVVEVYDPSKDKWTALQPMGVSRRGMGVAMLNGFIYVVGGSDSRDALHMVERYNIKTNTWSRVADLNQERSSVSAAVINDHLYAVGGYDGFSMCLKNVEKYNPTSNVWTYVAEMNVSRSMSAVGVVDGLLYIIGGYDGGSDLSSCEVYNPMQDKWTMIANMSSRRCMSGVGVLDGKLYVMGGCDCARSLSSVEVYDSSSNTWSFVGEMKCARSGVGVAVAGEVLYALGGYTGSAYYSSVEAYDSERDEWSIITNMTSDRRRFGCCS
jgi:N-acetylneuraminic acid mutarotase